MKVGRKVIHIYDDKIQEYHNAGLNAREIYDLLVQFVIISGFNPDIIVSQSTIVRRLNQLKRLQNV